MKTLPNNSLKRSLRSAPWPSPPGQAVQAAATPYVVLRPLHPSPCPPAPSGDLRRGPSAGTSRVLRGDTLRVRCATRGVLREAKPLAVHGITG